MSKVDHRLFDVLRYPHITEKTTNQSESNQVVFSIAVDATKKQVKDAVEQIFNVKVKAVNTIVRKGKSRVFRGRSGAQGDLKKAVVTLEQGQKIDIASGI